MLNRWLAGKQQEVKGDREKRPYLASECHDLNEADKWRQQILREIGRKVMDIQNAGLGEHRWGPGPCSGSRASGAGEGWHHHRWRAWRSLSCRLRRLHRTCITPSLPSLLQDSRPE